MNKITSYARCGDTIYFGSLKMYDRGSDELRIYRVRVNKSEESNYKITY